jgi:glycosyltransferase involved in cell wall biosynthesis
MVGSVKVHRLWGLQRRPVQTATTALSLAVFLLRNARRFDVVHLHIADVRTDVAVLVCRLYHKPVYVKLAAGGPTGDIGKARRSAVLTRHYGLRHAACLQAISAEIEADIYGLRIPQSRVAAIPNGLDPTEFHPISDLQKAVLRRNLGLPANRSIVLYLGRFAAYKGIGDLLQAWSQVRSTCDAELVFVGFVAVEDPYPIPAEIPGVTVREWTSHPVALYQAADVFVLPSHVEGMSNSLLEAMACGLPVVATSVGAAPEMIRNGVDGLLVPPGDPDAMAAALRGLLLESSDRDSLGAMARSTVLGRYSLPVVVDQIEARYLAVAQPRSGLGD